MHHELVKMLFNVLTWSWGYRLVSPVMLILLRIIFLFYLSDWWVCLLHNSPKMVNGLSASVPLWNPAIVSLKVITLSRNCSDLYEGKETCPKMIKEQPHTKPLVTLLLSEWVPWPLGQETLASVRVTSVYFCFRLSFVLNHKLVLSAELLKM